MITVTIKDQITPEINYFLQNNPRFISSLTKSIGWYVQGRIKKLTYGSTVTAPWQERIPLKVRRKLDPKAPKQWLGQLRRAIGYAYKDGAVNIGWTSSTAAMEGRIQEYGATKTVTPFLRRYFGRRGVHLRWDTTTLTVPARPVFEPSMKVIQPEIGPFMAQKVKNYVEKGGFVKSAGKGRKYEVFG